MIPLAGSLIGGTQTVGGILNRDAGDVSYGNVSGMMRSLRRKVDAEAARHKQTISRAQQRAAGGAWAAGDVIQPTLPAELIFRSLPQWAALTPAGADIAEGGPQWPWALLAVAGVLLYWMMR